ncbi:hypothetical protein SPHV1_360068 [Novosphingobium sp. KN65.2]|nr:hypothetical protein SPHV1_360068 [Novosphingobium sp. KN65.2]
MKSGAARTSGGMSGTKKPGKTNVIPGQVIQDLQKPIHWVACGQCPFCAGKSYHDQGMGKRRTRFSMACETIATA